MGLTFPLANAMIQQAEPSVGRRAGVLYLSNTAGAVCGSLAAGFLLLPSLGIQGSATVLMLVGRARDRAARAWRPGRTAGGRRVDARRGRGARGCGRCCRPDYVIARALARAGRATNGCSRCAKVSPRSSRSPNCPAADARLLTNGHPMSATTPLSQRYMRALAHIPLLAIESPEAVLVIGFGVGNTTHAATLHPSIRRVEVADLSKDILGVVRLLQARPTATCCATRAWRCTSTTAGSICRCSRRRSYDLITLEPPPIGYAGVAALYSQRVLRAGAHASQAGRLRQPVAAGVPGSRRRPRWR